MQAGKRRWVALALGLAVVAGGGLAVGLSASASAQATYEIEPREPAYLYARTCGYCHGHNIAPIIRGRSLPPAVIQSIVRSGMGAMPAFKPTEITDTELEALSAWISQSEADPEEHGQ